MIVRTCSQVSETTVHRLSSWSVVSWQEIALAVEETGLVRILGLNCPLVIFRRPNEFKGGQFDEVILNASRSGDGTFFPSPLDLNQSKSETGQEKDFHDVLYLESLVRADYEARLPVASLEEAEKMLGHYSEWQFLQAALENSLSQVQELAGTHLREFAAVGDPFSLAILEGRELP